MKNDRTDQHWIRPLWKFMVHQCNQNKKANVNTDCYQHMVKIYVYVSKVGITHTNSSFLINNIFLKPTLHSYDFLSNG
jgi:hypothetical protein